MGSVESSGNILAHVGDDCDNLQVMVGLTHGQGVSLSLLPLRGLGEVRIRHVACGLTHVVALDTSGHVYASNDVADSRGPLRVMLPGDARAASITCGPHATVVLSRKGKVFIWGRVAGSKGMEPVFFSATPVELEVPEAVGSVSVGNQFVVMMAKSGQAVYSWGSNAEWGLGIDEKPTLVARTAERVAFDGLVSGCLFTSVVAAGASVYALTDRGTLYYWGGRKKEFKPVALSASGLPKSADGFRDVDYVARGYSVPMVVMKDSGAVYWKKRPTKGDWMRWEPLPNVCGPVVALEDAILCHDATSKRVFRYANKTQEGTLLATIRVTDFDATPSMMVLCLNVYNQSSRIFGTLHPEPLLKLATAKGFVSWLVKTGCRYASDLGAFCFAFPVILKQLSKASRVEGQRTQGLVSFVQTLKKMYIVDAKEDDQSHHGVLTLLQSWLDAKPTARDAREVLQQTQTFLTEGEQATLWKVENMRAMPSTSARRMSGGASGASSGGAGSSSSSGAASALDMEDLLNVSPRTVAATLTLMRSAQFAAMATIDVVRFCTLTPDPSAFELYPRVAEYVDFGNTLGRWTKYFVLSGGSKQTRGERIKWLFQVVQELEALRNYDLCFHMSVFATWELMPEIAKQAKVDLNSMLEVLVRFGDRKFWNGPYQKALAEKQSMVALLVYHSNLISGGFGGSDSIIERKWGDRTLSYINVSKFRAIGEQMQLLQSVNTWEQGYQAQLKDVKRDSDLSSYFAHITVPSDAALTVQRAAIIPVSKHRESGKTTSFEQFSSDVVAAVSAKERRVVKWDALVKQLESEDETIRMREIPFLVCPRDAAVEGGLLPGIVKSLFQTVADVEWASAEYWLLRRILAALFTKESLEDVIMSAATLYERALDSLPQVADSLCAAFVDFVAREGDSIAVIKEAQTLERASVQMVPQLDSQVASFEEKLRSLKTQGGALSRKQILLNIGQADGKSKEVTISQMQGEHQDMEESLKLTKAKMEHFGAQRALMVACQGASRDFAVLFDLWRAQQESSQTPRSRAVPRKRLHASFFLVTHLGSRWKDGERMSFIHREPQGLSVKEFQDKLLALYGTVFGRSSVKIIAPKSPTLDLKSDIAYLSASAVRIDAEMSTPSTLVFLQELPYTREGSSEPWKQRLRYAVDSATTKKRLRVRDTKTDLLSPIESAIIDIQTRSATVRQECNKSAPDSSTALVLQSSVLTSSSTGLVKACSYLVDSKKSSAEVSSLSLAMWDFLLAVREGLAFFSTSSSDEDMRVHHILCKSFRELLALILPSLGPPAAENFHYASLYQFVSLLLPAGFAKPLIDSPMVKRRQSRAQLEPPLALKAMGIQRRSSSVSNSGSPLSLPTPKIATSGTSSSSPKSSPRSPRHLRISSARKAEKKVALSPRNSASSSLATPPSSSSHDHSHRRAKSAVESLDGLPASPFFDGQ